MDEMMRIDRNNKVLVLSIIGREFSIKHKAAGVLIVESVMGRDIVATVPFAWEWFLYQNVFNKLVIAGMNDHVITFDKDTPRVKRESKGWEKR